MKMTQGDMWVEGKKVALHSILETKCDIVGKVAYWKLYDLSAVGGAPGGLAMSDFEVMVRKSSGIRMSAFEFGIFSSRLEDINDIKVVGFSRGGESIITINIVDSSHWEVLEE